MLADFIVFIMVYDVLISVSFNCGRGLSIYDSNSSLNMEGNLRSWVFKIFESSYVMSLSDFDFFKCCNIRDCVCNTVDK